MDAFNNLSPMAKAGIALATGAGLMAAIVAFTSGNAMVLLIIALGIVVVGLLLVAYKFVLGWLGKRKAAPLERGILNNSAASPNSISEPARRARLDDLRRSFENGVEKFRASGKNIYSLPWYVLVGEPGSGKTEAIRHCNVGFPPGLQDQLQGAGGTLNMNWWFTNHAIILDTAGRLMFEEVEPGATSEWKEFLGLLTRARTNCPINGMLLVIPADSLIRDTADSIERKAGKIAQQLDSIQRQLGVRFPVFIVISKADLINGFREFFDTLTDPQLQHQIMGWSNPSPLDQPFSPEAVEKHLQTVAASLSKRRQGLLIDPVNTDDPNGRRVDQVDALYAFPESLLKIAPRLRRYLEMVFVAGEWSPKPLFLRGIYFTSSMREGSALDAELAEALKVPIESLPEGKVWERDRAYFLRDLFVQKVFKEKGLVTRASDTKKLQRNRKMAVMVTGFVGVFVLMALTFFGSRTLDKNIRSQVYYWSAASNEYQSTPDQWPLIDTKSKPAAYLGEREIPVEGGNKPRGKFHAETYEMIQKHIDVPFIFKPLRVFSTDLNVTRSTAYRAMYEASVLRPLMKATRDKLASETPDNWSEDATRALGQLIRMETYAGSNVPLVATDAAASLDQLAQYALTKKDYEIYNTKHGRALQDSLNFLYGTKDGGGKWPPAGISADRQNDGLAVIDKGVKTFNENWLRQVAGRSQRLGEITNLVDALKKFRQGEADVATATKNPTETSDQFNIFKDNWAKGYAAMSSGKSEADRAIDNLSKDGGWTESQSLANVFDKEVARISDDATRSYQTLLNHLPDEKGKTEPGLASLRSSLKEMMTKVQPSASTLLAGVQRTKMIPELDQIYLPKWQDLKKSQSRRYAIHYQVYERGDAQMKAVAISGAGTFSTIAGDLKKLDEEMQAAIINDVSALPAVFNIDRDPISNACTTAIAAAEIAARQKRFELLKHTLDAAPANAARVALEIGQAAPKELLSYRPVPLTAFDKDGFFAKEYHPAAASSYLAGYRSIAMAIADAKKPHGGLIDANVITAAYEKARKPIEEYQAEYVAYWTSGLREKLTVGPLTNWARIFTTDPLKGGLWEVRALGSIQDIDDASHKAIESIRPLPDSLATEAIQPTPLTPREFDRLVGQAKEIVAGWRSLGEDPEAARRTVIGVAPAFFESTYLFPQNTNPRLAERYLTDVTYRFLEALANDAIKNATTSLDRLKALSRFPLAKPVKGALPLTSDDIKDARNHYDKIKLPPDDPPGAAARAVAPGDMSKAEGKLKALRTLGLTPDDITFVKKVGSLLAVLPEPGRKLQCIISMPTPDEQSRRIGNKKALSDWSFVEALQASEFPPGKWPGARHPTHPDPTKLDDKKPLGTLDCPGDPIRFRLSAYPDFHEKDPVYLWPPLEDKDFNAASSWACLYLLHGDNVHRELDGRTWYVELPVTGESSFILKLEFDAKVGVPEMGEWPGAKQPK